MLKTIKDRLDTVNKDESGAEVIQVVLIATLFVALIAALGVYIKNQFTTSTTTMNGGFTEANKAVTFATS